MEKQQTPTINNQCCVKILFVAQLFEKLILVPRDTSTIPEICNFKTADLNISHIKYILQLCRQVKEKLAVWKVIKLYDNINLF